MSEPAAPPLDLSVVIPVRDEEDSLETLHLEIDAALDAYGDRLEIVFVDDGSRDASRDVMQRLLEKDPRVRAIALDGRHGQSAALASGFRAARASVVATLDADLQNDPADLPRLLEALGDADMVNGVRVTRRDRPIRRVASRIANRVRNAVLGEAVSDVGCSLRVMRAEFLDRVPLQHGLHRFLPSLLAMQGARIVEIPVSHRARRYGTTKYGIGNRLGRGLVDLLGVRWMQQRAFRHRERELSGGASEAREVTSNPRVEIDAPVGDEERRPLGAQPPVRLTR